MAEKKSAEKKAENKKLKITLVKSTIGRLEKQKRTVKALGLKKIGSVVVKEDTPAMRGMVFVVKHLVEVEEIGA
ncbi:MAG: 50S ribosomal protein L30 [Clostridia bacterium]|nr:50S ribosomal protein L30 [Clostridia bacterium]